MSSNLMDTEIGGEQTQYEAEYTDVQPRAKEAGQLGGMRSPMPQRHALNHAQTVSNPVHRPGPRHDRDTAQEGDRRAQYTWHYDRRQDPIRPEHPGGWHGRQNDEFDGTGQRWRYVIAGSAVLRGRAPYDDVLMVLLGYGGTKAVDEDATGAAQQRREQGYGGGKDMDRNIGA
jgi:hypothetical protein